MKSSYPPLPPLPVSKALLFGINLFLFGVQLGLGIGLIIALLFAQEGVLYILGVWISVKIIQIWFNRTFGSKNP